MVIFICCILIPGLIAGLAVLYFMQLHHNYKKYDALSLLSNRDRTEDELKFFSIHKKFLDDHGEKYIRQYSKEVNGKYVMYYSLDDAGKEFIDKNAWRYARQQRYKDRFRRRTYNIGVFYLLMFISTYLCVCLFIQIIMSL